MLCCKCKKRPAVVFVSSNASAEPQGYCLSCARELGIKPVTDMMEKMGISEVDSTGPKTEQYLTQCLVEQGGQLEEPTDYIILR